MNKKQKTGERLKQAGIERVSEKSQYWLDLMRLRALTFFRAHDRVTADDLREYADVLKLAGITPRHPNAWGAIFHTGEWVIVDYEKSKHPSNRARRIAVWALVVWANERRSK